MADYKVLIVDDDIWMQRILSKTLQSYGFNEVILASNAFEGIALAVEHQPSLIIMDILMPDLSGHTAVRVLKHIKITRNIPVLMVSAMSDTENLGLAVKSGVSGFISKPFTRATVYEKLIQVFGKEKVDKITKGEYDFADDLSGSIDNMDSVQLNSSQSVDLSNPFSQNSSSDSSSGSSKKSKEQLLKHYQDDEKRSIESIKKLLLKTRK